MFCANLISCLVFCIVQFQGLSGFSIPSVLIVKNSVHVLCEGFQFVPDTFLLPLAGCDSEDSRRLMLRFRLYLYRKHCSAIEARAKTAMTPCFWNFCFICSYVIQDRKRFPPGGWFVGSRSSDGLRQAQTKHKSFRVFWLQGMGHVCKIEFGISCVSR